MEAVRKHSWAGDVDVVTVDASDVKQVRAAMAGVDLVYYLLHSMGGDDFVQRDRSIAQVVSRSAVDAGVSRIVYLGGLIPDGDELSDHLQSRLEVETMLQSSGVPVVVAVRAGILVGGGSTSFELIRRLVERMPIIPLPRFMTAQI